MTTQNIHPGQYIHDGSMFSYYSAKTRAYLSYKKIPFVEQYDGYDFAKRIQPVIGKWMIPVVETPEGEFLQDTTAIIDALEKRFTDIPVLPNDSFQLLLTRIVEFIVDELWVVTAMNSRWNDPIASQFAKTEFDLIFGGPSGTMTGDDVAVAMQAHSRSLGINNENGQKAISHWFETATLALNKVVGPGRFALGCKPSLIDFCLYEAYYAHQYRDFGSAQAFMKTNTPSLCYFLDTMHATLSAPRNGSLSISKELLDYLAIIGPAGAQHAEGVELLTAPIAVNTASGDKMDRTIGPIKINLLGYDYGRKCTTFTAWKTQRIRDVYLIMTEPEKKSASRILDKIGWSSFFTYTPDYRLEHKGYFPTLA